MFEKENFTALQRNTLSTNKSAINVFSFIFINYYNQIFESHYKYFCFNVKQQSCVLRKAVSIVEHVIFEQKYQETINLPYKIMVIKNEIIL